MGHENNLNDTPIHPEHSEEEEEQIDSADEALCEMLGISSLKQIEDDNNDNDNDNDDDDDEYHISNLSDIQIQREKIRIELMKFNAKEDFEKDGVCIFPKTLQIESSRIKRLCDELVWSNDNNEFKKKGCDRTYETISKRFSSSNGGEVLMKRELTRLENFVNAHEGWYDLCHGYLKECVSCLMGSSSSTTTSNISTHTDLYDMEMVLFKEKLNLKPSGGKGFAPHLDTPSLRVPFGSNGPSYFLTVMVAIDNMTSKNGCLRVVKATDMMDSSPLNIQTSNGSNGNNDGWSEHKHVPVEQPKANGNPDADGRAGAISSEVDIQSLPFQDIICESGDIVVFNGWVPHHSSVNMSHFPRRAVFLTYNPMMEGDFHDAYYEKMNQMRQNYKNEQAELRRNEHEMEMNALNTIPKI